MPDSETNDAEATDSAATTEAEIAVREYVLDAHEETVTAVLRCADEVSETWADDGVTDNAAVVEPLSRKLRETDLLERFPDLLSGAVAAAGFSMPATPVPAPPYVTVASRGPVLRATVPAGRLVVSIRAFDVIREGGVGYARGTDDPREAVSVALE
ncbi:hypothetical protein [Haladaptatus sp. NG-WS-4]